MILFLSSSVPNLNGYDNIINHNLLLLEISANGSLGYSWRLALGISEKQRCLSDVCVT